MFGRFLKTVGAGVMRKGNDDKEKVSILTDRVGQNLVAQGIKGTGILKTEITGS